MTQRPKQLEKGAIANKDKAVGGVKLNIYLHLVLRLRMSESVTPIPTYLHSEILNSNFYLHQKIILSLFWHNNPPSPPVGQGLIIHEVFRSHTTTHHSR